MSEPAEMNALYLKWLEIPAERLPPNHYALLGIADFEADESIIESAAKSRSAYLHQIASGPQRKIVQEMLGKVAIAKRTLLCAESRTEYERSLRLRPSTTVDTQPTQSLLRNDSSTVVNPVRRGNVGVWKIHVASAGVLLAIVGVVYWVNQNPGGRRASLARSTETVQPQPSVRPAPEANLSVQADNLPAENEIKAAPAAVRKANPRQTTVDGNSKNSQSPIVKRRETGSGLGSGLGAEFSTVLDDIAKQPEQPAPPKPEDSAAFRPLAGLSIAAAKPLREPPTWLSGMEMIADFIEHVEPQDGITRGINVDPTTNRIQIKASKAATVIQWQDDSVAMRCGSAIAITASLSAAMRTEIQVGFEIDGVQIGIRPNKNGIEVFARDREPETRTESVARIKTDAHQSTFAIRRDPLIPDSIEWFVRSEDQLHTGNIGVTSISEAASLTMFVVPPKADMNREFWLSEWKSDSADPIQNLTIPEANR